MDDANDFETEQPTVTEAYVSLADTAALWRAQLASRPTVNLRPRPAADAQAVTARLETVRP
jgi:hypothetical protein